MSGKLYVVGTPIGNLGDLSPRAADVLSTVDFIAAEDTRVTLKLLNHLAIKKPMVSYHEHNKVTRHDVIADRIEKGESCALVTDAGMPAISDPGEDLVRYILDRGIEVESVPGPLSTHHGACHFRYAVGQILLRGLFIGQQTEQARASFVSEA